MKGLDQNFRKQILVLIGRSAELRKGWILQKLPVRIIWKKLWLSVTISARVNLIIYFHILNSYCETLFHPRSAKRFGGKPTIINKVIVGQSYLCSKYMSYIKMETSCSQIFLHEKSTKPEMPTFRFPTYLIKRIGSCRSVLLGYICHVSGRFWFFL